MDLKTIELQLQLVQERLQVEMAGQVGAKRITVPLDKRYLVLFRRNVVVWAFMGLFFWGGCSSRRKFTRLVTHTLSGFILGLIFFA